MYISATLKTTWHRQQPSTSGAMGEYQSLRQSLEGINISWWKSNILVWYRPGCLLNKSLVWCWTHTHTHTHTVTHIQTHRLRLWSKASYRVLLIFSPQNEKPTDPPLGSQCKTASVISCEDQSRGRPHKCVRDIEAVQAVDRVGKRWMELVRVRQIYMACDVVSKSTWVFWLLQFKNISNNYGVLGQSWFHVKVKQLLKQSTTTPLKRKYNATHTFSICDLIILYGVFYSSWHHYNVEIGTPGFALIFIQYPLQIQFSPLNVAQIG